jgi:hypothetical protein
LTTIRLRLSVFGLFCAIASSVVGATLARSPFAESEVATSLGRPPLSAVSIGRSPTGTDSLAWASLLAARGAGKIVASNGTEITGFTRHGINRAIGDGASRAGVKPEAVLDALKNPSKIVDGVDDLGRPFQVFHGADARVVVNPQTGNIVSMNPLSGAGAAPPVP